MSQYSTTHPDEPDYPFYPSAFPRGYRDSNYPLGESPVIAEQSATPVPAKDTPPRECLRCRREFGIGAYCTPAGLCDDCDFEDRLEKGGE